MCNKKTPNIFHQFKTGQTSDGTSACRSVSLHVFVSTRVGLKPLQVRQQAAEAAFGEEGADGAAGVHSST